MPKVTRLDGSALSLSAPQADCLVAGNHPQIRCGQWTTIQSLERLGLLTTEPGGGVKPTDGRLTDEGWHVWAQLQKPEDRIALLQRSINSEEREVQMAEWRIERRQVEIIAIEDFIKAQAARQTK